MGNGHYAWRIFAALPDAAVCLNVGAGSNSLVENLPATVHQLYIVELLSDQRGASAADSGSIRHPDNVIRLQGGDNCALPFPDNFFDFVSLSDVLAVIADDASQGEVEARGPLRLRRLLLSPFGQYNPAAVQRKLLCEVRRVLKDDGELFIGADSRLSAAYLTGSKEQFTGLRFVSLLPRWIANIYSIVARARPYRTYTYTLAGYRAMLRQAGFHTSRFLALYSDFWNINEMVPIDDIGVPWTPAPAARWSDRLRRHPRCAAGFGIIATGSVSRAGTPLLRALCDRISAAASEAGELDLEFERILVTGKDKSILFGKMQAGATAIVLRLPFSDAAAASERHNARVIAALPAELAFATPASLITGEYCGQAYFVETRCPGDTISTQLDQPGNPQDAIALMRSAWLALAQASCHDEGSLVSREYITSYLARLLLPFDDERCLSLLNGLHNDLLENLADSAGTIGLQHGDFSVHNILVENGGLSGVVDWELTLTKGLPVLDAINACESLSRRLSQTGGVTDHVIALTERRFVVPELGPFLDEAFDYCSIPAQLRRSYLALYWLRHWSIQVAANPELLPAAAPRAIERFTAWYGVRGGAAAP
ncbi:MAG: phosphotransferase [Halioglobus sp.]|nr:phosphotransferase [Halioglobus sp.]